LLPAVVSSQPASSQSQSVVLQVLELSVFCHCLPTFGVAVEKGGQAWVWAKSTKIIATAGSHLPFGALLSFT